MATQTHQADGASQAWEAYARRGAGSGVGDAVFDRRSPARRGVSGSGGRDLESEVDALRARETESEATIARLEKQVEGLQRDLRAFRSRGVGPPRYTPETIKEDLRRALLEVRGEHEASLAGLRVSYERGLAEVRQDLEASQEENRELRAALVCRSS